MIEGRRRKHRDDGGAMLIGAIGSLPMRGGRTAGLERRVRQTRRGMTGIYGSLAKADAINLRGAPVDRAGAGSGASRRRLPFTAVGNLAVGAEDGAPALPFEGWAGVGFAAGRYVAVACNVVKR
jgi:hypothetical protein